MSSIDDPREPQRAPSEPQRSVGVIEREETRELLEPGDHERFAHYVRKERILESALSGHPVIALCGKVWVPGRDPNRFPICPTCKAIYDGLQGPQDGGGSGSGGGSGGGESGGSGGD